MKKILSALKIFSVLLIFSAAIFPTNCQAGFKNISVMDKMVGEWYDENGNVALTIGSDYTINGCKIVDFKLVGLTHFVAGIEHHIKILEKDGYRDLILEYVSSDIPRQLSEENYHEMIIIDSKNIYYRSKNRRHVESVGGIYLGMKKDEVVKLYGEPLSVERYEYSLTYTYKYKDFEILFGVDRVFSIKLYDYGNMKFDKSGLSAKNSKEDYQNFYKPKANSNVTLISPLSSAFYIGHGEVVILMKSSEKNLGWVSLSLDGY
ncbi:MAG: hypothetical protein IKZ58_09265 [Selenomonadaceae bacterium]|nr:hypothetical protein [Selenomonadaceae bacterium]